LLGNYVREAEGSNLVYDLGIPEKVITWDAEHMSDRTGSGTPTTLEASAFMS
jgi:hypothetical protein